MARRDFENPQLFREEVYHPIILQQMGKQEWEGAGSRAT